MRKSHITRKIQKVPFVSETGKQKTKGYVYLRFTKDGIRNQKKTERYFIDPATTFTEKRHNKQTESDIQIMESELLLELQNEGRFGLIDPAEKIQESGNLEFMFLFQKFIDELESFGRNHGTLSNYRQTMDVWKRFLKVWTKEHKRAMTLVNVTAGVLAQFQQWMLEGGKEDGSGFARNSVARHMTATAALLNWLETEDYIQKSPMKKLRRDRIHQDDDPMSNPSVRTKTFATLDQLKEIYSNRHERKRREELDTTLCWLFACMVGLRYSDVGSLNPSNFVHIKNSGVEYTYLDIIQQKTKRNNSGGYRVLVPLNQTALLLLDEVKQRNPEFENRCFRIRKSRDVNSLFGTDNHLSFNNSRHTFSNLLKGCGVNPFDIDRLLGHKKKDLLSERNYTDQFVGNINMYQEIVERINFL